MSNTAPAWWRQKDWERQRRERLGTQMPTPAMLAARKRKAV